MTYEEKVCEESSDLAMKLLEVLGFVDAGDKLVAAVDGRKLAVMHQALRKAQLTVLDMLVGQWAGDSYRRHMNELTDEINRRGMD